MPCFGSPDRATDPLLLTEFRPRTSIQSRIFRLSVLIATFCVLLLGSLSFFVSTKFLAELQIDPSRLFVDPRSIGFTILLFTALLVIFGLLLSILLSRQIAGGIHELSKKARSIRTDQWAFPQTVHSGDEIEALDRIVANLTERLRAAYRTLEYKMQVTAEGLQRESALDSAILETIEYGVLVTDIAGIVTEVNPSALRFLSVPREQIVGLPVQTALSLVAKQDNELPEHPVTLALQGKHFHSRPADHLRLVRHDQTFLPISLIAAPLISGGSQFGCVFVFQDMTEERQIDYMKSEFISLASHQLRTPLSSIRWYAEMLSSEEKNRLTEDQQTYVTEIFGASVRMANLIEALLHVARIESGVLVPEKHSVDLAAFLRQTATEWDAMIREKHIRLKLDVAVDRLQVVTDTVLLQIILQNLLSNALKYSKKDSQILLKLAVIDGKAVVSVSDTGIGILPEDQGRVFQKFFRGRNARTIDTDGNGLGLYISRSVAQTLGATFDFISNTDKGSTFRVSLPVGTTTTEKTA